MSAEKSPTPPTADGGDSQAACVTEECPLKKIKYEIVEITEVVTQDTEKWVKGVAMDPTDTSIFSGCVVRSDKEGANYKQFINLAQDLEGQPKRRPEYGRVILLRARVKRQDGCKEYLAGVSVKFFFKRTDGPDRKDPSGEPAVFKGADLVGSEKEGYGSTDGKPSDDGTTDDKGWIGPVSFYLSRRGKKNRAARNLPAGSLRRRNRDFRCPQTVAPEMGFGHVGFYRPVLRLGFQYGARRDPRRKPAGSRDHAKREPRAQPRWRRRSPGLHRRGERSAVAAHWRGVNLAIPGRGRPQSRRDL